MSEGRIARIVSSAKEGVKKRVKNQNAIDILISSIDTIEKIANKVDKAYQVATGTLREHYEKNIDPNGSSMTRLRSGKDKILNATKDVLKRAGITSDDVDADELDKEMKFKTSGTEPPRFSLAGGIQTGANVLGIGNVAAPVVDVLNKVRKGSEGPSFKESLDDLRNEVFDPNEDEEFQETVRYLKEKMPFLNGNKDGKMYSPEAISKLLSELDPRTRSILLRKAPELAQFVPENVRRRGIVDIATMGSPIMYALASRKANEILGILGYEGYEPKEKQESKLKRMFSRKPANPIRTFSPEEYEEGNFPVPEIDPFSDQPQPPQIDPIKSPNRQMNPDNPAVRELEGMSTNDKVVALLSETKEMAEDQLALREAELFSGGDTDIVLGAMSKRRGAKKGSQKRGFGRNFWLSLTRQKEIKEEKEGKAIAKGKPTSIFGMLKNIVTMGLPILGTIAGGIGSIVSGILGLPGLLLSGIGGLLWDVASWAVMGLSGKIGDLFDSDYWGGGDDYGNDKDKKKREQRRKNRGASKHRNDRVRTKTRTPKAAGKKGIFRRMMGGAGRFFTRIGITSLAMNAISSIGSVATEALGSIKNAAIGVGEWLGKQWSGLKSGASSLWKGAKNTVASAWGSVKNAVSPITNAAGKVYRGVTNSVVGRAIGGVARYATSKAGRGAIWAGTKVAARWIGKAALTVFTGPVGWIITAGLLLWDLYDLYNWLNDPDARPPDTVAHKLTNVRMITYGLDQSYTENWAKVLEWEELAGRWMISDEKSGKVRWELPDEGKDYDDLMDGLGITGEDPEADAKLRDWFSDRFIPSYTAFLQALWSVDRSKKPGEIDSLNTTQLKRVLRAYNPPMDVFALTSLPFKDQPISRVFKTDYDNAIIVIKSALNVGHVLESDNLKNQAESKEEEWLKRAERIRLDNYPRTGGVNISAGITSLQDKLNVGKDAFKDKLTAGGYAGGVAGLIAGKKLGLSNSMGSNKFGIADGAGLGDHDKGEMVSIPEAIETASALTGTPADILYTLAKLESRFNVGAHAGGDGTARGVFQFTQETWDWMLSTYGPGLGLPPDADRHNILYSAIMAGKMMQTNLPNIKGYETAGMNMGQALYFGQFFGPGGVQKFISALNTNPDTPMEKILGTKEIASNKVLRGRTAREVLNEYITRWDDHYSRPAQEYDGFKAHMKAYPDLYKDVKINDNVGNVSKKSDPGVGTIKGGVEDADVTELKNPAGIMGGVAGAITNKAAEGAGTVEGSTDSGGGGGVHGESGSSKTAGFAGSSTGKIDDIGVAIANEKLGFSNAMGLGGAGALAAEALYSTRGNNSVANWDGQDMTGRVDGSGGESVLLPPIMGGNPYVVTSLFGPRNTGIPGASTNHGGIDYGVPGNKAGTPIVATGNGKVWRSYVSSTYGEVIYINHPDGRQTRYAHLQKRMVKEGDEVKAGQVIGLMGNTGVGTAAPHLHYEVRGDHSQFGPKIDPYDIDIIRQGGGERGSISANELREMIEQGSEDVSMDEVDGGKVNEAGAVFDGVAGDIAKRQREAGIGMASDKDIANAGPQKSQSQPAKPAVFTMGGIGNAVNQNKLGITNSGLSSDAIAGPKPSTDNMQRRGFREDVKEEEKINVNIDQTTVENNTSETNILLQEAVALLRGLGGVIGSSVAENVGGLDLNITGLETGPQTATAEPKQGVRDFRPKQRSQYSIDFSTVRT